jgi:hypothetical protein
MILFDFVMMYKIRRISIQQKLKKILLGEKFSYCQFFYSAEILIG